MLDYSKIGQRIRKLRREANLSQEQLAEKVWISTTHMSHIETGSTKLSLPVLVDIAGALNVSVDEILNDGVSLGKSHAEDEIVTVLDECSPQEALFIADIVKNTKRALDKHGVMK